MDLSVRPLVPGAHLSMSSFVAARHPAESCGTNGLPLTPNSICILGQSQTLRALPTHPNVTKFLDCKRGKHERIVVVHENYKEHLGDRSDLDLISLAKDVVAGLAFLHHNGFVHACLEPCSVVLDPSGRAKVSKYWLGHLTSYGEYVSFPIFNPRFVAPEVLSTNLPETVLPSRQSEEKVSKDEENGEEPESLTHIPDAPSPRHDERCDIWSLGIVLACKALGLAKPWATLKTPQILRKILSFQEFQGNVFERLARENDCQESLKNLSADLRSLIERCLQPNVNARPTAKELFAELTSSSFLASDYVQSTFPTLKLRCRDLTKETWANGIEDDEEEKPLDVLSMRETYYLWQLAGGDIWGELRQHGLMVTRPPVLSLPKLVLGEGHTEGETKERCSLYDPVDIPLPLQQLTKCLDELSVEDCYPLMIYKHDWDEDDDETAALPLVIKEADVKYQFKRIVLYRRLLQSYPHLKPSIRKEAGVDALPLYRAYIWASLLEIEHDTVTHYESVDKETWTPTDRQIEVDIPRCHQYNNLLASPEGHRKFKRVLKAWVQTNPQYVYWQGLDSLCAPFLYLNFNDEALAFASLSAFIPKYLFGMFQRDNAPVIQEYLAKFSHVQAFHDARLFSHLDGIGFIPDLYAIPWILTMFAHVFPLQNIFHLWDKLLLGDSSFPLCIGLAVLMQLRERLLSAEFNDCILLFSDLPAIDIERCVKDSVQLFCTTPKSLTWRKYGSPLSHDQKSSSGNSISPLSIETVTLKQQRAEKVPRISGNDLLQLLGLQKQEEEEESDSSSSLFVNAPTKKCCALVVDVRSQEEHKRGSLPDSLNLPPSSFDESGQLSSDLGSKLEMMKKGKVICVVGSAAEEKEMVLVAEKLLELHYDRLCMLHNGIEIFKPLGGVLCVPDA